MNLIVHAPAFRGSMRVPPSKSHTMRALLCASLGREPSCITAPLVSADTLSAAQALRQLGVTIEETAGETDNRLPVFKVTPPTAGILSFREAKLDLGNSGSLLYFLGVILAAGTAPVSLTGDTSLRSRPVEPLLSVYRQAGISYSAAKMQSGMCSMDVPPLTFCGPLPAQEYRLTGPFSQPVTGLLLAAPLLQDTTRIVFTQAGERPYLKMTCDWLRTAGIAVTVHNGGFAADTCLFEIAGNQQYQPFCAAVPGDWSSALFPITAAVICNAELHLTNLDPEDSQGDSQAVKILQAMGADIRCDPEKRTVSVFPRSCALRSGHFDCADIPDAVPILAAAALFCSGQTLLTNAGVCRFKECDRLHAAAEELAKFGAHIEEGSGFLRIDGTGGAGLRPAWVHSHADHRIAMMLAVAASGIAHRLQHTEIQADNHGTAASGTVDGQQLAACQPAERPIQHSIIEHFDCVGVSYPQFIKDMNAIGASYFS